ncbi:helix-turn-helix domain-containing protein [Gluconobacter oxydans]|uniref:helix-turn-helix domain-containing protein n=1 Tax=Gluconobacter oxydans TaxID=442 RepID=UPI0039EC8E61
MDTLCPRNLAEFERSIIAERTRAGLEAAKIRGKTLGRPRLLSEEVLDIALSRLEEGNEGLTDIARSLNVSPRTLSRHLINAKIRKRTCPETPHLSAHDALFP